MHKLTERYESHDDDDESDKHLEARDRRYSCLICLGKENIFALVLNFEKGDNSSIFFMEQIEKLSSYAMQIGGE